MILKDEKLLMQCCRNMKVAEYAQVRAANRQQMAIVRALWAVFPADLHQPHDERQRAAWRVAQPSGQNAH